MELTLNIIFFVSSLDSGGMENYLLRFLTEKHECFNNVYVWCKSGRRGQLDSTFNCLGRVRLIRIKLGNFDFRSYSYLKRFIIKKEIDVVCDFTGNFSGRVILCAKEAGVKRRVSAYRGASHRFTRGPLRDLYDRWVRNLVYRNSTDIISNSKAGLDYFYPGVWRGDARFKVIYNGVNPLELLDEHEDLRAHLSIPKDAFVVGHTGRFNSAKNHATILLVAEILVLKYPNIYFIMCGNGVRHNLVENLKAKGIERQVLVFENRNDIPRFLNTMDCYFFPSVTEGQPNALIEAMIMGLPFVASDIPPIRETVGTGYPLYPAEDADSLTNALEEKYLAREVRSLELRQEAINRFDYRQRFEEFYKVLSQ